MTHFEHFHHGQQSHQIGFLRAEGPAIVLPGIQSALDAIGPGGAYAGDNIFTYHRNLGFLEDEALMQAFRRHAATDVEQAVLWRIAVVLWGVRNGLRLAGISSNAPATRGRRRG
ncbi:hypothetical protein WJ969_03235 [Achromobacter xylosoxidans]